MTATSPRAFLMSAALHAAVAIVLVVMSLVLNRPQDTAAKIFELVAGEGDNYAAREAPALGTPGGAKAKLPKITEPAAPVAPATKATPPANDAIPNFKKKIQYEIVRGDAKAKLQLRREREAEAKRLAEEKKRMSLEDLNRANKAKANSKSDPAKIPRSDGEGIAKGVVGGSVDNKVGGAGGKALRNDSDDVLAAYDALFKQRLRAQFEAPPGLSDSLKVHIEVRSNADGSLSNARATRGSGSREFDRAVLDAIARVRMPERPDRKSEIIDFDFTMRPLDDG